MKIYLLCFLLPFFSCSNPPSPTKATAKKLTTEDSLYHEVIGYHDEAMPKMGRLIGYQKTLKTRIDSLEKIAAGKKDIAVLATKKRYQQLLMHMQDAEKEMNNWMDSFDPDPKFPTKEDLLKYLKDQQQKAKKMRDDMLQSLDSAKNILN